MKDFFFFAFCQKLMLFAKVGWPWCCNAALRHMLATHIASVFDMKSTTWLFVSDVIQIIGRIYMTIKIQSGSDFQSYYIIEVVT